VNNTPIRNILQRIASTPWCKKLQQWIQEPPEEPLRITDATGSLPAFIIQHLWESTHRTVLCILPDDETARYLHNDLEQLALDTGNLLLFPPSGRVPYDQEQVIHSQYLVERADVMQQLSDEFSGILITSVPAIVERTPARTSVFSASRTLRVGDILSPDELVQSLVDQGFVRVRFIVAPGEVAWRGGIVDIYSYSSGYPIRIEFLGDDIESIREFDTRSQRSISNLNQVRIVPRLEQFAETETRYASLFDFLPKNALQVLQDNPRFEDLAKDIYETAEKRHALASADHALAPPQDRYLDPASLQAALAPRPTILVGTYTEMHRGKTLSAQGRPQPAFNRQMKLLREHLEKNAAEGCLSYITCDSTGQKERLSELLDEALAGGRLQMIVASLHQGFELPAAGLAVYTDHEIFGRHHRPSKRKIRKHGGIRLHELRRLQPGDFVVHTDYGVGKFAGFRNITVRGRKQEAVRLHYAGGDVLYVNVNALYKLHKYSGKEGHKPKLTTLGSGQWEKAKRRTKKRVKDIARDLIKLYAQRKASVGYRFPPDTIWQREMEAAFPFEDTPDQFSAVEAVKRDMEALAPMDRLVCGDVGFGKTEVAIRAAFKAAHDNKQVAILVPTTILARQHHETFSKRMEPFPLRTEMLSRHRPGSAVRRILKDLKAGKVDILVGTHRIISKDVVFKDLGLLIIDEEQRFGVSVKERLRQLRAGVDTLTMTATPIPRTLQFSLMGARDLSIINTPPPNRQSIATEIHSFDTNLVKDAILYEVSRGGQVFFVHNRVKSITDISAMLRDLVPGVRLQVAHGQMRAGEMDRIMTAFIDRKFDVLVSTTIIENGIDIPNANTMIVNDAQRFGLAELHQLRGRVGRSSRKAYCYLLVPSIHVLTREARQRLRAVEELSELGSGFQIAMRDMDIRGAGNVLGGEQSGFINELGFATYHQILDEALREIRDDEMPELDGEAPPPPTVETSVDIDTDASIPRCYVESDLERLGLYRRLSETTSAAATDDLHTEIRDRFGPLPPETQTLFAAARMRLYAQALRLPRALHRNQRLFLHLPLNDSIFREHCFQRLLDRLENIEYRYVMKESRKGAPRAIVQDVPTLETAVTILETLSTAAIPEPSRAP